MRKSTAISMMSDHCHNMSLSPLGEQRVNLALGPNANDV